MRYEVCAKNGRLFTCLLRKLLSTHVQVFGSLRILPESSEKWLKRTRRPAELSQTLLKPSSYRLRGLIKDVIIVLSRGAFKISIL
jgi:hypothetical protein